MLLVSGLFAQSTEFSLEDDEFVVNVEVTDTVAVESEPIPVKQLMWDELTGAMEPLKQAIIDLSKESYKRTVTSDKIAWIYEVSNVPTSTGKQTVYLSILKDKPYGYFLSKQNPNNVETICECYLALEEPETVKEAETKVNTSSRYQTDDPEEFGEVEADGTDRKIENNWWPQALLN